MAVTNLVYKVVALTVFVIIATQLLIPVVNDAQDTIYVTGQNTSQAYQMTGNVDTFSVTVIDNVLTVKDYVPTATGFVYPMLADTFMVRYTIGDSYLVADLATASYITTSISVTPDKITFTDSDNTEHEVTYTGDLLYMAEKGSYGFFRSGDEIRFNDDSYFYIPCAIGVTVDDVYNDLGFLLKGNASDISMVFGHSFTVGVTVTSIDTSISYNTDPTGFNVVEYSTLSFDIVLSSGSTTYTYSGPIIAPIDYKYHGGNEYSLLAVIPVLVIVAAIIMAVGLFRGKS